MRIWVSVVKDGKVLSTAVLSEQIGLTQTVLVALKSASDAYPNVSLVGCEIKTGSIAESS